MTKHRLTYVLSLTLVLVLLAITGCKQEDPIIEPTPDPDPIEQPVKNVGPAGLYVFGSGTVADTAGAPEGKINLAILDPGKGLGVDSTEGIYGRFLHVGANSTLSLVFNEDTLSTSYGATDGGAKGLGTEAGGAIDDEVTYGALVENGDPIQVAEEGLYYLYVNLNEEAFILIQVKFNIIGDATEKEWAEGTFIEVASSDKEETVFHVLGLPLKGNAGYRYRFGNGWHIFGTDTDPVVALSSMGVENYGAAYSAGRNDIGFFLENAPNVEDGLFNLTVTYDAKNDSWRESKNRTGDLPVSSQYTDMEIGLFGNAYFVAGTTEGAWDDIHFSQTPTQVNDSLFSWTWTQELIQNRSFVLREDTDNGTWITYGGVERAGTAFTEDLIIKEQGQDNFFVTTGGTYILTLTINAFTDARSLEIIPE